MSSASKQLIQRMFEAYSRGDVDTVLDQMTDDIEWYTPGVAPFAGHRQGRDQMRAYLSEIQRLVEIEQFDIDELLADGDKVVVLGRQRGTVRETGARYDTLWAHVYTLRNGRVAAGEIYSDTQAVAAAFGESARERQALTGSLGVTHPAYSDATIPSKLLHHPRLGEQEVIEVIVHQENAQHHHKVAPVGR